MKRIIPFLLFSCFTYVSQAQTITKANFVLSSRADNFRSIELELDNKWLAGINGYGDLLYLTTRSGRDASDSANCPAVKYYDKFDIHDIPGKIKSIGNIRIAYNNAFDIHDTKGTLKSVGDIQIRYYNDFDIHDPKGKIKSVGTVNITYFNTFDADYLFGKIKSIKGNNGKITVFARRA